MANSSKTQQRSVILQVKLLFFVLFFGAMLAIVDLTGCSLRPSVRNIDDACSIFMQRQGWFENWYKDARASSRRYGIDVEILLATMRQESGFRANAKTRWRMALGFIPWGRVSSAYGYAQALDGTWKLYERSIGRSASRSSFTDSIDFIAWYYRDVLNATNINPHDAYHLYIAYVVGANSYKRYGEKAAPALIRMKAREVAQRARLYHKQLRQCSALHRPR